MKFILPIPPSINRTYGVTRIGKQHLYKKRDVRSWEWEAGWEIKRQKGKNKTMTGKVSMTISFFYGRDRDIDNGLKVLLDLFQHLRIYENDKQVVFLEVSKEHDTSNQRVEITVVEKGGDNT